MTTEQVKEGKLNEAKQKLQDMGCTILSTENDMIFYSYDGTNYGVLADDVDTLTDNVYDIIDAGWYKNTLDHYYPKFW